MGILEHVVDKRKKGFLIIGINRKIEQHSETKKINKMFGWSNFADTLTTGSRDWCGNPH
jgi:hypothetical protein